MIDYYNILSLMSLYLSLILVIFIITTIDCQYNIVKFLLPIVFIVQSRKGWSKDRKCIGFFLFLFIYSETDLMNLLGGNCVAMCIGLDSIKFYITF